MRGLIIKISYRGRRKVILFVYLEPLTEPKKSKAALAWAGGGTGVAGTDSSTAALEAEHSTPRKKPN